MKIRNMVRGGAILAVSLGLASLGTGMGLVASHSSVVTHSAITTVATSAASIKPQLICDPGYGCGTKEYFLYTTDQAGQTLYNETIVNASTGAIEGCVVAVAGGVVIATLTSGFGLAAVGLVDGGTVLASCAGGVVSSAIKWISNLFSVQRGGNYSLPMANSNVTRLAGS
nr:hypothetical protein [Ferrimicrobium acidiphilum]